MDVTHLIKLLMDKKVQLWLEDGKLAYSAPKGALTSEVRSMICENKLQIIELLKPSEVSTQIRMQIAPCGEKIPLSFAQQGLWALSKLDPGNTAYNITEAFTLCGSIDVDFLNKAIEMVYERQHSLRTCFCLEDGVPIQVINKAALSFEYFDFSKLEKNHIDQLIEEHLNNSILHRYDMEHGPIFFVELLKTANDTYVICLNVHHIVFDAQSLEILISEIIHIYTTLVSKTPLQLSNLAFQYTDYAYWQRMRLNEVALDQQKKYWVNKLRGLASLPIINMNDYCEEISQPAVIHQSFLIDTNDVLALKHLASQYNCTVFIVLLVIYKIVLHRYYNHNDICVATVISDRNVDCLNRIIGNFVSLVLIRDHLTEETSLNDLVYLVRESVYQAFENRDYPFEKLIHALGYSGDSVSAILKVAFSYISSSPDAVSDETSLLTVKPLQLAAEQAKFPLSLMFTEGEDQTLCGELECDNSVLDKGMSIEFVNYFLQILKAVTSQVNTHVALWELHVSLPLQPIQTPQALSTTPTIEGITATIDDCFRKRVLRQPEVQAVVYRDKAISYASLDAESDKLAQFILQRRQDPCDRDSQGINFIVAIYLNNRIFKFTAILAILKAGGAYLPIDTSFPTDYIEQIIVDSKCELLIAEQKTIELQTIQFNDVLIIDDPNVEACLQRIKLERLQKIAEPNDLAYVIYTSGSTGKPKGVKVRHATVYNLFQSLSDGFNISPSTRVLQFASISFDASVAEWVLTLLGGGTLYTLEKFEYPPHVDFIKVLQDKSIQVAILPPSLLAALDHRAALPNLHTIISAGEPCSKELVNCWQGGRTFINAYGPSECTVCVSYNNCKSGINPTIGLPLKHISLYILDKNGQQVPKGGVGELYVTGGCLAAGYLNDEKLTQSVFIHQEDINGQPTILYRTQDLVRQIANGELVYVGRCGSFEKIRGYRIELSSIENILLQIDGILQCCAMIMNEKNRQILCVYYIANNPDKIQPNYLESYLKRKLPSYMIPNYFIAIEKFPRTLNGKINRKNLPKPRASIEVNVKSIQLTPLEQLVSLLWCKLLQLEQVDVDDNFFYIGGSSLTCIKLVNELRDRFSFQISIEEFFKAPTIRGLAAQLSSLDTSRRDAIPSIMNFTDCNQDTKLFFIHPVGGTSLCYAELASLLANNFSCYGINAKGINQFESFAADISVMASDYINQILHIEGTQAVWLVGYSLGGLIAYEMACQMGKQCIQGLVLLDSCPPEFIPEEKISDMIDAILSCFEGECDFTRNELDSIPGSELFSYVRAKLVKNDSQFDAFTEVEIKNWIKLYKHNIQIAEKFSPKMYDGDIVLFRALLQEKQLLNMNQLGWSKYVTGSVNEISLPGQHKDQLNQENTLKIAKSIIAINNNRMKMNVIETEIS